MDDKKDLAREELCDETHSACDARLKKYGDDTKCCFCSPHHGCKLNPISPIKKPKRGGSRK